MDTVRTELAPRFGTDEDPLPGRTEKDDDPFEAALSEYREAFKEAGDLQTAAAFEEGLDAYLQIPTSSREDYST